MLRSPGPGEHVASFADPRYTPSWGQPAHPFSTSFTLAPGNFIAFVRIRLAAAAARIAGIFPGATLNSCEGLAAPDITGRDWSIRSF